MFNDLTIDSSHDKCGKRMIYKDTKDFCNLFINMRSDHLEAFRNVSCRLFLLNNFLRSGNDII